ncbi:hypothetical protein GCM10022216_02590 [Sphingobacterium kyonggiense]|uniref:Uncharacterized protein n=1 Tax=Sphingobacterium kyonggiense TaxID=714075 RepID=A0ABP7Y7K8_9SPHI
MQVEKQQADEVKQQAGEQVGDNGPDLYLFVLFALDGDKGNEQAKQGGDLGLPDVVEQACFCDVFVDVVGNVRRKPPLAECGVAGNVKMDGKDEQADQPCEIYDLAQSLGVFSGLHNGSIEM